LISILSDDELLGYYTSRPLPFSLPAPFSSILAEKHKNVNKSQSTLHLKFKSGSPRIKKEFEQTEIVRRLDKILSFSVLSPRPYLYYEDEDGMGWDGMGSLSWNY